MSQRSKSGIQYPIEQYGMRKELSVKVAEAAMNHFWIRFAGKPSHTCDGKIEAFLCNEEDYKNIFRNEKYMLDDGKYPKDYANTSWLEWDYAENMTGAMKVVAEMRKKGFKFEMVDSKFEGRVDITFRYKDKMKDLLPRVSLMHGLVK